MSTTRAIVLLLRALDPDERQFGQSSNQGTPTKAGGIAQTAAGVRAVVANGPPGPGAGKESGREERAWNATSRWVRLSAAVSRRIGIGLPSDRTPCAAGATNLWGLRGCRHAREAVGMLQKVQRCSRSCR